MSETATRVQTEDAITHGATRLAPIQAEQSSVAAFAHASNALGFDLWSRLRHQPGNLAVSPASVELSLAMALGGARSDTYEQMRQVLHVPPDTAVFHDGASALIASWNASQPSTYELRTANRLFADSGFEVRTAFLELTRNRFGAPMELVDFRSASNEQRLHINRYVADATKQRIRELLPPQTVTSNTRLVLVNALYIMAGWSVPFDAALTRNEAFHVDGVSATEERALMHQLGTFGYFRDADATVVQLPYQGEALAMLIAMPNEISGLAAVEASLDTSVLLRWTKALEPTQLTLTLPRFAVQAKQSLRLASHLSSMGMKDAFDSGRADFTAIAKSAEDTDSLYLSEVYHSVFVTADEAGTEAAAATGVVALRGTPAPHVASVRVDRPFLFFIRDVRSGLILIMGRVVDPRSDR